MKLHSDKVILCVLLTCACVKGEQNTNLWPAWEHPRKMYEQLQECYTGIMERAYVSVTNAYPNEYVSAPSYRDTSNTAKVIEYKNAVLSLLPNFVYSFTNLTNAISMENSTGICGQAECPTNYFDYTPYKFLSGLGVYTNDDTVGRPYGYTNEYTQSATNFFEYGRTNFYTTDYGIQEIRDMLEYMRYTTIDATVSHIPTNSSDTGIAIWYTAADSNFVFYDWDIIDTQKRFFKYSPISDRYVNWPSIIFNYAYEPNDVKVFSNEWSVSTDYIYCPFYESVTNRGRFDWNNSYKMNVSGNIRVTDDYSHSGIDILAVHVEGDSIFYQPYTGEGQIASFTNEELYVTFGGAYQTLRTLYTDSLVVEVFGVDVDPDPDVYWYLESSGYLTVDTNSWEYLGSEVYSAQHFSPIYNITNNTWGGIPTNFLSNRRLALQGRYPHKFYEYYAPPIDEYVWTNDPNYSLVYMTNRIDNSIGIYYDNLVWADDWVNASSEYEETCTNFVYPGDSIASNRWPFYLWTSSEQAGWGSTNGIWVLDWFNTNGGFSIR